jgi:hypothetical protein
VIDVSKKDDIPEVAASFRIKPHSLVIDDSKKDDIPEGAASFRYQTT